MEEKHEEQKVVVQLSDEERAKIARPTVQEFKEAQHELWQLLERFYLDHPNMLISACISADVKGGNGMDEAYGVQFAGTADAMRFLKATAHIQREAIDVIIEREPDQVYLFTEWLKGFLKRKEERS